MPPKRGAQIKTTDIQSNIPAVHRFEDMDLKEPLLRGLIAYGFKQPSAIQQRFIVPITKGKDVIAQASSGTGKTSGLCICLLQLIDTTRGTTQALTLSPTRELAAQTEKLCTSLGQFMGASAHACVGGTSRETDTRRLLNGVNIVSGTPGRVYDMIKNRSLRVPDIKLLVLDEADEMLRKEFKEQIHDIYRHLPPLQVVLISATLPAPVLEMAESFMSNPVRILLRRDEISVDSIREYFVNVEKEEHKYETVTELYSVSSHAHAVIFCNTRKKVEWLAKKLTYDRFPVIMMHGDMAQQDRDNVMEKFRSGQAKVLITTDVWARGIDVDHVSLIINYDIPLNRELYIHRIGRVGRFGRVGIAISLAKTEELKILRDIEQFYSKRIEELPDMLDGSAGDA